MGKCDFLNNQKLFRIIINEKKWWLCLGYFLVFKNEDMKKKVLKMIFLFGCRVGFDGNFQRSFIILF